MKTNKLLPIARDFDFRKACCSLIILELRVIIICLETRSSNIFGIYEIRKWDDKLIILSRSYFKYISETKLVLDLKTNFCIITYYVF